MTEGALPIVSLFSGALGLDLGLERAGFHVRVAVEPNKYAAETIRRNRPDIHVIEEKIEDVKTEEILEKAGLEPGEPALVSGGPSCQTFSTAGRRGSLGDPRGVMFREFLGVGGHRAESGGHGGDRGHRRVGVLKFVRGRTFRRRLELTISGEVRRGPGIVYLLTNSTVKNIGLSKFEIGHEKSGLRVMTYASESAVTEARLAEWKPLSTWAVLEGKRRLEPGEPAARSC